MADRKLRELEKLTKRLRVERRLLEREIALNPGIVKPEYKKDGERIRERFFRRVLRTKRRGQA